MAHIAGSPEECRYVASSWALEVASAPPEKVRFNSNDQPYAAHQEELLNANLQIQPTAE